MAVRPIEKEEAKIKLKRHLSQHGRLAEILSVIYIRLAGCPSCHAHLSNFERVTITK